MMQPSSQHPIILFDGVCNLCNRSVRWIIRLDRDKHFRLAPLQSAAGQAALRAAGMEAGDLPDSMVLIQAGQVYVQSEAVLRMGRALHLPWSALAQLGLWVPIGIRNALYRWIARNRYRWFGQQDACSVPDPTDADRFLTDAPPHL